MAPRPRFLHMVDASRDEAQLAVRLYNDPGEVRSFEGFVVHMHLAWLYLLHAELSRDAVDFRYWRTKGRARRLERIDGEPKRWDLATAREQQALAAAVGGQSQALLLNYEEEVTGQFGLGASLATRLRFPVFIGSFTDEGERALRRLRSQLPAQLRTFIAEYDAGSDDSVARDPRYDFRLRVFQELAPKDPDALAVQFTCFDDLTEEQREAVEAIGRKGYVVVREHKRPVVGHGLLKPTQAAQAVQNRIPFCFTTAQFTKAWKKHRQARARVRHRSGVPVVARNGTQGQGDRCVGGATASERYAVLETSGPTARGSDHALGMTQYR